MSALAVLKNTDFQLVSEFAQPDAKKRLSLGAALAGATAYNIYRNPLGQLILDPVKAVPACEMWLYENAEALASVKQGLRESAEGKSVYRGSFAKHARE
jgi:CRISPR/Cas system-associated protein Csm6